MGRLFMVLLFVLVCSIASHAQVFNIEGIDILESRESWGIGWLQSQETFERDYGADVAGCALVELNTKEFYLGLAGIVPFVDVVTEANAAILDNPGTCVNHLSFDNLELQTCEISSGQVIVDRLLTQRIYYSFKYTLYCLHY